MQEVWYRYSAQVYDDKTIYYYLNRYPVIKHTPKGVWIDEYGQKHLVLHSSVKKWAAPTPEEAWKNYKARANRRRIILAAQLDRLSTIITHDSFKSDNPPDDMQNFRFNDETNLF